MLSLLSLLSLTACQLPYYIRSAYHQVKILSSRQDINKLTQGGKLPSEIREKLLLAQEAKQFAEKNLGLSKTENYETYVDLGRPYVSYILRASPVFELKHHLWKFPFVGSLPYKGYFVKERAIEAAKDFPGEKFDTYIRGVSAYSTLGYFNDPILSSMMRYRKHDLVNTIIHELVHATVYIESEADFNERLATYIGDKGTELFYKNKEGPDSQTLKVIQEENEDRRIVSEFMSVEIRALKDWYKQNKNKEDAALQKKKERLEQIQIRFRREVRPQLKRLKYDQLTEEPLNNAKILSYQTYMYDLSEFESLYEILDKDFAALVTYAKNLEKAENPEAELTSFVMFHKNATDDLSK